MEAEGKQASGSVTATAVPAGSLQGGLPGPWTAVVDGAGVIVGWTVGAERALGYRAAEVVGRSAAVLLAADDPSQALATWAHEARRGRSWAGMTRLRAKDGTTKKAIVEVSSMVREGRVDWFVTVLDPSVIGYVTPMEASVTAELLGRSPIGLSVWDTDLRCIWLNSAAAQQDEVLGRPRLGRLMGEMRRVGTAGDGVVETMRHVLETGEPVIEREYTWRVPGERDARVLSASYFRLDGPDGRPIGVCNMAMDIRKSLARQHLLALGEMGGRIGTTLDVGRTAQELADATVPLLADYVSVDLQEAAFPGNDTPLDRLDATPDSVPVFRRAGLASSRPGRPEAVFGIGEPVFVPPSSPFTRALGSGRTHFEPVLDTSRGTWLDKDPRRAEKIALVGAHSLIIVPLRARGRILGEAVFVRHDNCSPFSRDDLLLIKQLADRAALSLDNARRFDRERTAALALQRNLMPRTLTGGPGVEVASRYLPSDTFKGVGGDWFDVVPLPQARVGLVIGDVVGHGINAAALMGKLRTVTATLADLDVPPEEVLARLDRRVGLMNDQDTGERGPVMTCTCAYVVYDPVTRQCTMASAGHPPPAVVLPDGNVVIPAVPTGPPIGLGTRDYASVTLTLPEGSVIALYTDGLVETRDTDLDTRLEELRGALSTRCSSLEALSSYVISTMAPHAWPRSASFPGGGLAQSPVQNPTRDDIALLLARTRALTPEEAAAQPRR